MALLLHLHNTMTQLWPQEDWTGNFPVWSECNLRRSVAFMMVTKTEWVRLFCGSWDGLKSSDVCMSRSDVILVDCAFFCFARRWPLLVARDLAKCLVTREAVRPGQDSFDGSKKRWMGRGCTSPHVGT
jgi:hypothetical protein